jgi:type 1 glutamine amidotransferase
MHSYSRPWATALIAALTALPASAQTGNPGGRINDRLGAMDYGVCRGTDPACYHDWPRTGPTEYRVLLFTRTPGPRHANLGPALAPGLNPPLVEGNIVQREMVALLAKERIKVDYTEDLAEMQAPRLNGYSAVIFFSTSRDTLDDGAKTALRQYLRAGGGFVGIHNAFGTLYNWPYYEGMLGGANYYDHGPVRSGDIVVVDKNDASTKGLPQRWRFVDEWYNLVPFPTRVHFLATVDERSWLPGENANRNEAGGGRGGARGLASVVGAHPGHGAFHPVAWCQYYDGGKVWVTTLGHDEKHLFDADNSQLPGALEFQKLIVGGIRSAMGLEPFCR